ncbi:MAG: radical SAM protein [Bacteroidales bacterium]|nr:radical SAM protein [Bacteroidales bacterium]
MMREETVFGPIFSRRLGSSLGINLLPVNGKLCNFDCIYCECGWNKDGRDDKRLPTAAEVRSALEDKLQQCMLDGTAIDSITFSGDGEPTLNPDFPRIIDDTLMLRNTFFPSAKVSVLSNATRLSHPEVVAALRKVDNPILKIDAPTAELAARINQPYAGYEPLQVVRDLAQFEGDFVLQTMFLRSPSFDSSSPEVLLPWMEMVRVLRPREIMVYTIDRPTPGKGLEKFTEAQMRSFVQPLLDEGFNIQIKA